MFPCFQAVCLHDWKCIATLQLNGHTIPPQKVPSRKIYVYTVHDQELPIDQDLKKIYKSVLPLCEKCKANGKSSLKCGELQTALANRARGKQKKQKK